MESQEFQQMIDSCTTAEHMVAIAGAYLSGTVVRDLTAAQGWLMKAIEADDPVVSPQAMGILARQILKRDRVIPPGDVPDLRSRWTLAEGREREELEALLKLI